MPYMYALYVCLICMPYMYASCMPYMQPARAVRDYRMPYMYALYVSLICMPYMYALYVSLICMRAVRVYQDRPSIVAPDHRGFFFCVCINQCMYKSVYV